jgi:hypothetical protein
VQQYRKPGEQPGGGVRALVACVRGVGDEGEALSVIAGVVHLPVEQLDVIMIRCGVRWRCVHVCVGVLV